MKNILFISLIVLVLSSCGDYHYSNRYSAINYALAKTNVMLVTKNGFTKGSFVAKPLNGGGEIVIDFSGNQKVNTGDTVAYTTDSIRYGEQEGIWYHYQGKK